MSDQKNVKRILVSACLLGDNCKYDGGNNYNKELADWLSDKEKVALWEYVESFMRFW